MTPESSRSPRPLLLRTPAAWLPREPRNAVLVMLLQAMTAMTALVVLFWMEHSG